MILLNIKRFCVNALMIDCYIRIFDCTIRVYRFKIPDVQPNRLMASRHAILMYITNGIAEDKYVTGFVKRYLFHTFDILENKCHNS